MWETAAVAVNVLLMLLLLLLLLLLPYGSVIASRARSAHQCSLLELCRLLMLDVTLSGLTPSLQHMKMVSGTVDLKMNEA